MTVYQKEKTTLSVVLYVKSNSYCKSSGEEVSVRPIPVWWTRRGLNPRPLGCEPSALPAELRAPFIVSILLQFMMAKAIFSCNDII